MSTVSLSYARGREVITRFSFKMEPSCSSADHIAIGRAICGVLAFRRSTHVVSRVGKRALGSAPR